MGLDKYLNDKDFHRYLDSEMTPDEKKRFEENALRSSEQQKLLRFFRTVREEARDAVKREMEGHPANYLWNSVRDRLEASPGRSWFLNWKLLRAGSSLALACVLILASYHFLARTMTLPSNNECMIEYIDNRTDTVTIFRGTQDGMTYIWITENPDSPIDGKHSLERGKRSFSA